MAEQKKQDEQKLAALKKQEAAAAAKKAAQPAQQPGKTVAESKDGHAAAPGTPADAQSSQQLPEQKRGEPGAELHEKTADAARPNKRSRRALHEAERSRYDPHADQARRRAYYEYERYYMRLHRGLFF